MFSTNKKFKLSKFNINYLIFFTAVITILSFIKNGINAYSFGFIIGQLFATGLLFTP